MNTVFMLAAGANDQHVNGPVAGGGGIIFVCLVIWLLLGGSGPKK